MVFRDVIFDEIKGWNWKKIDGDINNYNDFEVILGEFGNYGIIRVGEIVNND